MIGLNPVKTSPDIDKGSKTCRTAAHCPPATLHVYNVEVCGQVSLFPDISGYILSPSLVQFLAVSSQILLYTSFMSEYDFPANFTADERCHYARFTPLNMSTNADVDGTAVTAACES